MLISNCSSWTMLAVLESQAQDGGGSPQDNGRQYLALLLFKACLNACGLAVSHRSLRRTLLGVGGISVCLADTLLLGVVAGCWALGGQVSASVSLCFAMSHAATVYSLLPVPFLLLGALDHARNLSRGTRPAGPGRALARCAQVLCVWALAGLHSYRYTSSQVIAVSERQRTVLLCAVRGSCVNYFCAALALAVACVLLFYRQTQPSRFREVSLWPGQWGYAPAHAPSSRTELRETRPEEPADCPLLLRLTAGFAATWAPFLALSVGSMLFDLPVPSYLSVNVIWLLCVNSLLIGAALWLQRDRAWPCDDLPDDACAWGLYWRHGNGGAESRLEEKLAHDIYTLSGGTTDKLLQA